MQEKEFRRKLLNFADKLGCGFEVKQILQRYDNLLKNCPNEKERNDIAAMGIAEIHKLMGCYGNLVIDGKEIIPANSYSEIPIIGKFQKI